VLTAALRAGFRESGAINITSNSDGETTPIVAVRSTGLAFDSIVGYLHNSTDHAPETPPIFSSVGEPYLQSLVEIGNMRFQDNARRIERFSAALDMIHQPDVTMRPKGREWEDADTRRERKRAEGLKKRLALQEAGLRNRSVDGSGSEEGTIISPQLVQSSVRS
jgi:tRNA wybutosine-synthesizing protein 3